MPNAKDRPPETTYQRLLVVGRTGSGKTSQIWTLPGKKFAYIFDPNAMATLRGCDLDYEEYYPDFLQLDATLKGFNKGSKSDRLQDRREPTLYLRWVEDINKKVAEGFFKQYDWIVFDSLTFLVKAIMDRQAYINNRYGEVEERGDYRVVGSKTADLFTSICSLSINIYATAHIRSFENETTHKVEVELSLPGRSRTALPLMFTSIWEATYENTEKGGPYYIRTKPDPRGLKDIRSSIPGLETMQDVTIKGFNEDAAGRQGIGALISRVAKQRLAMVK